MERYIAIMLVTLVLIIVLTRHESFNNRDDKAAAIFSWFGGQKNPEYVKYRKFMGEESNIVDYDAVRKLFKNKDLTLQSVKDVI